MNKTNIKIWGRDFELPITIKTFSSGKPTEMQMKALENFLSLSSIIDESKKYVENYICDNPMSKIDWEEIDNIFKYIMPKCIYVPKDKNRIVAILCYYKFDMEHNLSIVFENEKFKSVGSEDDVL